jgi:hypothetical protein
LQDVQFGLLLGAVELVRGIDPDRVAALAGRRADIEQGKIDLLYSSSALVSMVPRPVTRVAFFNLSSTLF